LNAATRDELAALNRLIRSYREEFREEMTAPPDLWFDPASCAERAATLPEEARDLLDTLLLAAPAGASVDPRFRSLVEEYGGPLWREGFLLPRTRPTPGARLDPRHFAATCRTNPALTSRRPLAEHLPAPDPVPVRPSSPASNAHFDAAVVAATLEASPLTLNRDGAPRRDALERRLDGLGPDRERWQQALRYARATGLIRPSAGQLYGYPESRPRRPADPAALLENPAAGRVILGLLQTDWVDMEGALEVMRDHARAALFGPRETYEHLPIPLNHEGWDRVEALALRAAAAALHRLRALDAALDADGVRAIRLPSPPPRLAGGFLLTPDLDVLIAPGELSARDYGRLCRLAPYVAGDRVHRHRLTREGIAADLRAGHKDALDFLKEHSRTGLPQSVEATVKGWTRSTGRITLLSGATVVERDGVFTLVEQPPEGRTIDYLASPTARFTSVHDPDGFGELHIAYGEDALAVRYAVSQVAAPLPPGPEGHRYAVDPQKPKNPPAALARLAAFSEGPLPGALEAAVLAASGAPEGAAEPATLVRFSAELMTALRRDPTAGPLLLKQVDAETSVVLASDLDALKVRLSALGVPLGDGANVG